MRRRGSFFQVKVSDFFRRSKKPVTVRDLREAVPEVSDVAIYKTLKRMEEEGTIVRLPESLPIKRGRPLTRWIRK